MVQLSAVEARVLGVLIEKALTTPAQYPLTLNALTVGSNQKNNRLPVTNLDEDRVFDAVDSLRHKGLVREAMLSGSRVAKFRHTAREVLGVETPALVVLTELMLRGPQSLGDLRQNTSRMHPIESLEALKSILDGLAMLPEPMVREYPPPAGSRAKLYRQLIAPNAHAEPLAGRHPDAGGDDAPDVPPTPPRAAPGDGRIAAVEGRVQELEAEVARLRAAVDNLATALGLPGPS